MTNYYMVWLLVYFFTVFIAVVMAYVFHKISQDKELTKEIPSKSFFYFGLLLLLGNVLLLLRDAILDSKHENIVFRLTAFSLFLILGLFVVREGEKSEW